METSPQPSVHSARTGHTRLVKFCHWIGTVNFIILAFTGVVILMAHPRLYWGEVGNNLTPALIELPISRNHKHGGWEKSVPFFQKAASPISANRSYPIFNMNGWGRSLHFLAAWLLALIGAIYLLAGIFTGHFQRHFLPQRAELAPKLVWRDVKNHLSLQIPAASGGPHYGLLQKITYFGVVFLTLPLAVVTGLTMSPAITAGYPFLLRIFGGYQSARTIHFVAFIALMMFLLVHVVMIVKSGFRRQMRAMTIGR